jgi:TPR repeat protein
MRLAAMVDNLDAEVEYAIALYNGTGTPKDVPTAIAVLNRAARQNSPIAQNRLARILVDGLGVPVDKVQGFKWHLIAKTAGNGDPDLDAQFAQLPPIEKAKSEDLAKKWFGTK